MEYEAGKGGADKAVLRLRKEVIILQLSTELYKLERRIAYNRGRKQDHAGRTDRLTVQLWE